MALFYNRCGSNRLQVNFISLQLKHLGQGLESSNGINYMSRVARKRFFGVHAPDSPAVATETNTSLLVSD